MNGSTWCGGVCLLALCVMALPARAAIYHVAPDGDDAGPGAADRPWATLEHASAAAQPGDTVLLAPGEYAGVLSPARSGEPGAPITFRAAKRHQAVLTGPEDGHAAVLRDTAHIRLDGLAFRPTSPRGMCLLGQRAAQIELIDLMMDGCARSDAVRLIECEDVRLTDCTIRNGRAGNMVHISDSQRLVFEGCELAGSAHALLLFLPDRTNRQVIIRGCVFAGTTGRTLLIDSVEQILFEHNIIVRSLDGGRSAGPRFAFYAANGIFRGNRVFDNWGPELLRIQPYRETLDFDRLRFYNNVFDRNCSDAISVRNFEGKYNIADSIFANNVFSGNERFCSARQIIIREDDPRAAISFRSNLIDGAVQVLGEQRPASEWPADAFMQDTIAAEPGFTDAALWDHRPAEGSPLIDAGAFLTQAVADGEGTRLQVADAHWFCDGFGIAGEPGDVIAVGSSDRLGRVVRADYAAGLLELDRPLQWREGDPVSLPWAGERPEIGVYEVGSERLLPPIVLASPYASAPGEPVLLRAILPTIPDGARVQWQLSDGTVLEGAEVQHAFAAEGEWGLRVRVTGPDGEVVRAAGMAIVQRPRAEDEPLLHSTFGPDDADAWWQWQTYRPGKVEWGYEETDEGWALRIRAPEDNQYLPCRTNPREWDVDRDPLITVRYRISEGAPVAASIEAFSPHETDEIRRMWLAATPRAMPLRGEPRDVEALVDDGAWHTLTLDARRIREQWPEVTTLMRFAFEGQWVSARDRVRAGDEFWLGEVTIGPERED